MPPSKQEGRAPTARPTLQRTPRRARTASRTAIVADAPDWDTSPCPGHPPFESCGPAISAEPWPEPGRPDEAEPRYASARIAGISAACGSLEAACALLDLERDLDLGGGGRR